MVERTPMNEAVRGADHSLLARFRFVDDPGLFFDARSDAVDMRGLTPSGEECTIKDSRGNGAMAKSSIESSALEEDVLKALAGGPA